MKITRRQCLCLGAGFVLTAISPICVYGGVGEDASWQDVCRRWMHVFVPDDGHGPGADTPPVWSRLKAKMDSDPAVKRWLVMGFSALAVTDIPKDDRQLNILLSEGTPLARFLDLLRLDLIESYYATESGWRDLGFGSPPIS